MNVLNFEEISQVSGAGTSNATIIDAGGKQPPIFIFPNPTDNLIPATATIPPVIIIGW